MPCVCFRKPLPVLATVVAFTACGDPSGPGSRIERLPRELTAAEQQVVADANGFGLELLKRVVASDERPNVFISPLSASMALGMTLNGAAGATFDAMRGTLGFAGMSQEEINQAYRGLLDLLLELDARVTIEIANSTWARQGLPFVPAFFEALETWFDAEARELDFSDPAAADVINRWASEKTHGRIDEVLDRIDPDYVLFLLNALYFKGKWTTQFDRKDTRAAPFRRDDGTTLSVPTMHLEEAPISLGGTPEFTIGELPYGGGAFVMTILVPEHGRRLDDVVAALDAAALEDAIAAMREGKFNVALPKFRLEYEAYFNEALQDMGMEVAFTPAADFSRMTAEPVCISFVKQNTFVEVNEEGTEAAAVTTVGIGPTSLPPGLYVDRPFLFLIRERFSGTILFAGTVADPTLEDMGAGAPFEERCRG